MLPFASAGSTSQAPGPRKASHGGVAETQHPKGRFFSVKKIAPHLLLALLALLKREAVLLALFYIKKCGARHTDAPQPRNCLPEKARRKC